MNINCLLESLDVSYNAIKDNGGIALAIALRKSFRIMRMNLDANNLSEPTGKALKLSFLNIKRNVSVTFNYTMIPNKEAVILNKYFFIIKRLMKILRDKTAIQIEQKQRQDIDQFFIKKQQQNNINYEIEETDKLEKEEKLKFDEEYAIFEEERENFLKKINIKSDLLLKESLNRDLLLKKISGIDQQKVDLKTKTIDAINDISNKIHDLKKYILQLSRELDTIKEHISIIQKEYEEKITQFEISLRKGKAELYCI